MSCSRVTEMTMMPLLMLKLEVKHELLSRHLGTVDKWLIQTITILIYHRLLVCL